MPRIGWRRATVATTLAAGAATVLLAACGSSTDPAAGNGLPSAPSNGAASSTGTGGKLGVVAAENFWGNIASQIGGPTVAVTSIISDPNTDPHAYETNPRDAAALARAGFVIDTGYLIEAAGLKLGTPASFSQSIEDGNDPSPGDTAAFQVALKDHKVKALLYNAQVTSPITQQLRDLAKSSGVPVVGVTETLPPNEKDFQTWQTDQAQALLTALGG
jgi:ABC-type Zn uptake system ZnuABC Zn-binding protein ZnuA